MSVSTAHAPIERKADTALAEPGTPRRLSRNFDDELPQVGGNGPLLRYCAATRETRPTECTLLYLGTLRFESIMNAKLSHVRDLWSFRRWRRSTNQGGTCRLAGRVNLVSNGSGNLNGVGPYRKIGLKQCSGNKKVAADASLSASVRRYQHC